MDKSSGSKEQCICMTELKHSHAFWTQLDFWRSHGGLWKILAPESPRRHVAIYLYASTEIVETGEGLCLCSLWQRTEFFNRKMTNIKCPFPTSGICSEATSSLLQESFKSLPTLVLQQMCYFQNSDLEMFLLENSLTAKFLVQVMLKSQCCSTVSTLLKKNRKGSWLFDLKQILHGCSFIPWALQMF